MSITDRITDINHRIIAAERAAHRAPGSVLLLAVSKTRQHQELKTAYETGLRHFGENYLQEALSKQQCLKSLDITWHFIGPIQSNKTHSIANHFSWVHSVDRFKIARRLSEHRSPDLPSLNVCLQVNISSESSKSGLALEDLSDLAAEVLTLRNLRLRGLMAIPAPEVDFETQRQPYKRLRTALENLQQAGCQLDTLSIGMSDDLEAAIAEGSTIVRIGTAIFGPRN